MTSFRLSAPVGTYLDRARTLSFEFNGRRYSGLGGDTLASALLANDVRLVARSFKLHRPRGIFAAGVEEPSALVDVGEGAGRAPNQRATLVELAEGLRAVSVNCWPSVNFDLGAINSRFAAVLPAGFYYKTFKWPNWHWFEPSIRRMAGLGRASGLKDPDRYDEVAARVDVLVAGGGIAGLSAAVAAAEAGAKTWLLASGLHLGGQLSLRKDADVAELILRAGRAGVKILTRTLAFGLYDHNLVCARETLSSNGGARERLWKIRATAVIAAAGAFERPMIFPGNDRPGVMLAGAAAKYAHAYGVACGRRVVLAANCDAAYRLAESLRIAGVNVIALVDRRAPADIGVSTSAFRVITGAGIDRVRGTRAVRGCTVVRVQPGGRRAEKLDCDAILSAGGFAPAVHLHSQAGGRLRWLDACAMFVPDGHARGFFSVGACAGVFDKQAVLQHAAEVGRAAATGEMPPVAVPSGAAMSLAATHVPGSVSNCFVDLQNDVAVGDVGLAARENYRSVEHLKRYTTTGMGTDQGKTSNINALVLMGEYTGRAPGEVGTTKFRPPFAPVTLGLLAGRRTQQRFRPLKRLTAEDWHVAHGALIEQFGSWCRPVAYPLPGESFESAAQREAGNVRRNVGIFDGSPLGKLEVFGPDAAGFLDLMYVGTLSTLQPGQARYGVTLNENGIVTDDGIVARLSKHHFWVNTTSAGVERTVAAFEEWLQCEYPHLKVVITQVTSRWGNVTVAGPKAWELLAAAGFDSSLAPDVFAHMHIRDATYDGVGLRVLRASFSGELGYEINLPVERTEWLLDRLWSLREAHGAALYGIEALEILRTEKGYLHIGTDTDGTTLPGDVGFARALDRKAANFVGRRSLLRPAARDASRLQLVALSPVDGTTLFPVGGNIAAAPPPALTEGHVTSSYMSPTLGAPVALALLRAGTSRLGERVRVFALGRTIDAVVVKAPFL